MAVKIDARDDVGGWNTNLPDVLDCLHDLTIEALCASDQHHKQWYLEQIALGLGIDLDKLREDGVTWDAGLVP